MAATNTCTFKNAVKEYNLAPEQLDDAVKEYSLTPEQLDEVKQMLAIVYQKPLTEAQLKAEDEAWALADAESRARKLANAPAKARARAKIEKRKSQFCGELQAVVDVNIFNDPEFTRDLATRYDDVIHKNISYVADGEWHGSMINTAEPYMITQFPIYWIVNQGWLICPGSLFYSGDSQPLEY